MTQNPCFLYISEPTAEDRERNRRLNINRNLLSCHSMKLRNRAKLPLTIFEGFENWDSMPTKQLKALGMTKKIKGKRAKGAQYSWK